jgi:hypothetical protein
VLRSVCCAGGGGEAAHAPAFLWLLRDFQLQLRDGDRQLAPRDYIEEVLQELAGSGPNVANSNQVCVCVWWTGGMFRGGGGGGGGRRVLQG